MTAPRWLDPVQAGLATIRADDLTRFVPPDDHAGRRGAVLMLFGEGPHGHDLLLTERAHTMRTHPGQVSFPGGSIDPGETPVETALREAWEETGLDPSGVEVLGQLPELWLPPSNFAVTPVLGWWQTESPVTTHSVDEVHAIHRVPLRELIEPEHRVAVRAPGGWLGPAYLIGPEHDVLLWGFTAGIISRYFEHIGWADPWDTRRVVELPARMLEGERRGPVPAPNTTLKEDDR
ncbi:NUDIX hydrolase [Nocardioides daejeonensis]|uniref:NUDIX hydrolase n=1 Tax=Nocardioides daejeonensis TaxID=1046556 RepID=UPI000D74437E|nr:CoA pyrophosphatase [Nocardioides daejeonensis]